MLGFELRFWCLHSLSQLWAPPLLGAEKLSWGGGAGEHTGAGGGLQGGRNSFLISSIPVKEFQYLFLRKLKLVGMMTYISSSSSGRQTA